VLTEEMSFQLSFDCCQGFCIPDEGGEIVPPARNRERECSRAYCRLCVCVCKGVY